MSDWRKENCITIICTTALILGLYALGAGGHSFWAFVLLMNINYVKAQDVGSQTK